MENKECEHSTLWPQHRFIWNEERDSTHKIQSIPVLLMAGLNGGFSKLTTISMLVSLHFDLSLFSYNNALECDIRIGMRNFYSHSYICHLIFNNSYAQFNFSFSKAFRCPFSVVSSTCVRSTAEWKCSTEQKKSTQTVNNYQEGQLVGVKPNRINIWIQMLKSNTRTHEKKNWKEFMLYAQHENV